MSDQLKQKQLKDLFGPKVYGTLIAAASIKNADPLDVAAEAFDWYLFLLSRREDGWKPDAIELARDGKRRQVSLAEQ